MELLNIPAVQTLFCVTDNRLRLVGGCVRDYVLGILADDIDLASPLTPDEMEQIFVRHSIHFIDTGRKHGTLTAILDKKPYEVTTLRVDKKTDGRHAEVSYIDSYEQDAHRRDFTINALYMDHTGKIYDYLGGMEDLRHNYVRFIGDPNERITEDTLRLLRYFRFWGKLGHHAIDTSAVTACQKHAPQLKNISSERKTAELMKILEGNACDKTFALMQEYDVLPSLLPLSDVAALTRFLAVRPRATSLEKLSVLTQGNLPPLTFSKAQKKQLELLGKVVSFSSDIKKSQLLLAQTDRTLFDFYIDRALGAGEITSAHATQLRTLPDKKFPLVPDDLLKIGFAAGPEIGQKIATALTLWVDLEFTSDKKLVLQKLLEYTQKK